jgi:hypothetical protein
VGRPSLSRKSGLQVETIALADDREEANGIDVLDFWQAQEAARSMRPGAALRATGYTVKDAVADYLIHLEGRSSWKDTKTRLEAFVLPAFAETAVNDLEEEQISRWHRGIAKRGARARTPPGVPQN